ncbi:Uncharacterised protein [Vibrio cholerae]|nr:Uncharacterised protein [Vibrio cholerae]
MRQPTLRFQSRKENPIWQDAKLVEGWGTAPIDKSAYKSSGSSRWS